ncbi:MAG: S8 family serine peptidase [Clostridia bacterium]|nr:S8 family serine peptidase [Clostridia bacterium]
MNRFKKGISVLLAGVMAAGCISCVPFYSAAGNTDTAAKNALASAYAGDAAENELIVTFSENVSDKKIEKTADAADASVESITDLGDVKIAHMNTEQGEMAQTAETLAQRREVQSVQPNYKYTPAALDPLMIEENDVNYQYQFEATKALAAWDTLESGNHAKTRVAVIDTGVDTLHEDLQDNLIKKNGKYAQFAYGTQKSVDDDVDEDGHGTHVFGIIGATFGNGKGGSGIASGHNNDLIEVLPVGGSADGYGLYTIDVVESIAYAVKNGAKVINMSFGSSVRDLVMNKAIQDAYYKNGVAFIASSGNEDNNGYSSPSDLKEVLSVNASNRYNEPTYYSNYGVEKDITAPGNAIMSTLPGDDYNVLSGTSMAAPVVTGIAGLVLDANPNLTPAQLYNILCASAKQPAGVNTRFDDNSGYGIIDADAAVKAAKAASTAVAAESISVKSESVSLHVGETYGAEALVQPASSLAAVTWSSANESIARIDKNTGMITGVAAGETVITASASGKTVTQKVVVKPTVNVSDIKISGIPASGELALDDWLTLSVQIEPEDATFTDYYLTSSNPKVLGAFEGGELIPFSCGKATVTVASADGNVKKSFTITVKNSAYDVVFTKKASYVMLGKSATFTAKCVDENGSDNVANATIEYTSSNKRIFTIDKTTGVVKPVALGKAYVIAKNPYSGEYAAVPVIVAKTSYAGADYALKQTKRTKDSVTLSWNSIPVATKYKIERKDSANGAWKAVATTAATSYRQIRLVAGKVYYYRVTAIASGYAGTIKPSNAPACTTTPNYKLKQSAKTKTSITLKWNKVPDAASYYVQYRTSTTAAWKNLKLVNAKTLQIKHSGLKANKTVYYRVLATYKVGTAVRFFEVSPAIKAKTAR